MLFTFETSNLTLWTEPLVNRASVVAAPPLYSPLFIIAPSARVFNMKEVADESPAEPPCIPNEPSEPSDGISEPNGVDSEIKPKVLAPKVALAPNEEPVVIRRLPPVPVPDEVMCTLESLAPNTSVFTEAETGIVIVPSKILLFIASRNLLATTPKLACVAGSVSPWTNSTNTWVALFVKPADSDTNRKSTLPIEISSILLETAEPVGWCWNPNDAEATVDASADELTSALAGPKVPSSILTTVKVSEFFKYSSAACDVKNWNESEPLRTTSPNIDWYSW